MIIVNIEKNCMGRRCNRSFHKCNILIFSKLDLFQLANAMVFVKAKTHPDKLSN